MTTPKDSPETTSDTSTIEEANEAGYLGVDTDPVPNEAYTVEGVTGDQGLPEPPESKASTSSKKGG